MARIPPVDPTKPQNPAVRAVRAAIKTPAGTWFSKTIAAKLDPLLLKATNGRVKAAVGFPTVNLTTTGRKSGAPRTSTVLYFTRGEEVVLVASKFGSAAGHPAWYLNLKANPAAELVARGKQGRYVLAREAEGEERERLYGLAEQMYGGYANYKVQAGAREIPVLVLTPAA